LQNLHPQLFLAVGSVDLTGEAIWGDVATPGARECTRISIKDYQLLENREARTRDWLECTEVEAEIHMLYILA